ncbi:unnamed protein product [Chondrus crispus]|uniref:Uncharacterized protein n=1 Tax=Chondrus crispus TaxID=2769 RepID=R7QJH8_CHOCR|nr:unnamed protein product [Chondrus crispus]CDF38672.1 unnamed protein product [Chondrus crispus]|eukprot:XP_005718577.1 unnamed protein product [Chondrus crispus]
MHTASNIRTMIFRMSVSKHLLLPIFVAVFFSGFFTSFITLHNSQPKLSVQILEKISRLLQIPCQKFGFSHCSLRGAGIKYANRKGSPTFSPRTNGRNQHYYDLYSPSTYGLSNQVHGPKTFAPSFGGIRKTAGVVRTKEGIFTRFFNMLSHSKTDEMNDREEIEMWEMFEDEPIDAITQDPFWKDFAYSESLARNRLFNAFSQASTLLKKIVEKTWRTVLGSRVGPRNTLERSSTTLNRRPTLNEKEVRGFVELLWNDVKRRGHLSLGLNPTLEKTPTERFYNALNEAGEQVRRRIETLKGLKREPAWNSWGKETREVVNRGMNAMRKVQADLMRQRDVLVKDRISALGLHTQESDLKPKPLAEVTRRSSDPLFKVWITEVFKASGNSFSRKHQVFIPQHCEGIRSILCQLFPFLSEFVGVLFSSKLFIVFAIAFVLCWLDMKFDLVDQLCVISQSKFCDYRRKRASGTIRSVQFEENMLVQHIPEQKVTYSEETPKDENQSVQADSNYPQASIYSRRVTRYGGESPNIQTKAMPGSDSRSSEQTLTLSRRRRPQLAFSDSAGAAPKSVTLRFQANTSTNGRRDKDVETNLKPQTSQRVRKHASSTVPRRQTPRKASVARRTVTDSCFTDAEIEDSPIATRRAMRASMETLQRAQALRRKPRLTTPVRKSEISREGRD